MKFANFNDISYALNTIARDMAAIKKKEAELNAKIHDLKAKFDEETAPDKKVIELLSSEIEKYCIAHKNEFEKTRNMQFTNGTIGFRINPPKVMQLNRKFSVTGSIELIKKIFKNAYIRFKEEIDKDAILADYRQGALDDKALSSVGLRIDQSESFYINPNWEKFVDSKIKSMVSP